MPSQKEVQELIAQGRQSLGLTQRELAKKVGVSAAKLSFIEAGTRSIKVSRDEPILKKLAEVFKCDWRVLVPDPPARPKVFDQLPNPIPVASPSTLPEGEEEMTDPAMMPVWAKGMKCIVKVAQQKPKSNDYVKIRNKVNGSIAFRLLSNEAGCLFLYAINPGFQTFTFDPEDGMFEIVGVVTEISFCKK